MTTAPQPATAELAAVQNPFFIDSLLRARNRRLMKALFGVSIASFTDDEKKKEESKAAAAQAAQEGYAACELLKEEHAKAKLAVRIGMTVLGPETTRARAYALFPATVSDTLARALWSHWGVTPPSDAFKSEGVHVFRNPRHVLVRENFIKMTLQDFIIAHAERGACTCGRCADAPANPEQVQPTGHTADLVFFKVCAKGNPSAEELRALIKAHEGEFGAVNLFDGKNHSYLEIGGFVGDQGLALMLMGLGTLLGLWKLLTPRSVFGAMISADTAMQMAGAGYVTVQSPPPQEK